MVEQDLNSELPNSIALALKPCTLPLCKIIICKVPFINLQNSLMLPICLKRVYCSKEYALAANCLAKTSKKIAKRSMTWRVIVMANHRRILGKSPYRRLFSNPGKWQWHFIMEHDLAEWAARLKCTWISYLRVEHISKGTYYMHDYFSWG